MASYLKASIERSYAESFLSELERNDNQYFFFIGKGTTWANENSPSTYVDSVKSEYQVMNDIIGYKKLNPENIIFALPRYEWASGTTYDQYDDNLDLFDDTDPAIFYVVTDQNNIYKCLSNGGTSPARSTVKPTQVVTTPFETSDGYRWQYLATVKESSLPYELTDYIPVDFATTSTDTETQNQYNTQIEAVNGSITRMVVTNSSGASAGVYTNTLVRTTGIATDYVIDVASVQTVNSTTKKVRITDSLSKNRITVNTLADYVGYVFRIERSSNSNEINNYGVITAVSAVGTNNDIEFTITDDAISFSVTPTVSGSRTSAEILPHIKIVGNGSGAYAFPVMSSTKTISDIDVVDGGRDYSKVTAEVISPKTAVTNHPIIRPILSPKGGHGSNLLKELNVKDVLIIVEIDENDADTIIGGGTYRQFGIIKNPLLGDGTGTLAGKDDLNYRDITLLPVDSIVVASNFTQGDANLIIGTESYSSAKIVGVKSESATTITVKTLNTSGKFITKQDRVNDFVLTLTTSTGLNFFDGETVSQTIPAGTAVGASTYGFDLTVTGKVVSRTTTSITVRLSSDGNFIVSGSYPVVGEESSTSANVSAVTPRYGEDVWVTSTVGGAATFLSNSGGNQKMYKVVETGQAYFDLDNTPAYRGLHILELATSVNAAEGGVDVTSAPLTPTAFSNGDTIHQGVTGAFGHYATGVVYNWDFVNPSYGRLYLTDGVGAFKSVEQNGLTGSELGAYIVSTVDLPEIDRTSGEVLYIDNVRPITRTSAQEEEFRLRLGF